MKNVYSLLVFLLVTFLFVAGGWAKVNEDSMKQEVMKSYGKLPLYFIQNDGQVDNKVKFYTKGSGHSVFFADDGVYVSLSRKEGDFKKEGRLKGKDELSEREAKITVETVTIRPLNAKENPEIIAEEMFTGKVNYFRGNDPSKWKTDIPTYGKVRYKEVYPGIDIVFYGNQSQLEYDVVVKPGADYKVVKFEYEGIKELKVNESGELVAVLSSGLEIIQKKPYIYQEIEGKKIEIDGRYEIESKDGKYYFSFKVFNYNPEYALVIDPVLAYSTYLGGSGSDEGRGIAVDTSGNAYVTGYTWSTDFPTQNAIDSSHNGDRDVFVTKLSSTGSLIYSTYLGGSHNDEGFGIAVDTSGNAYVTGYTWSTNFPTLNAYDSSHNGYEDVFVTKLSSTGNSLIYSTYLGGSSYEYGRGIAVDTFGNAYVTGWTASINFPTLNAYHSTFNGTHDAFVTKLSHQEGIYTGDFNGDGRTDILTRDTTTGNAIMRLSTVSAGNWNGWINIWAAWHVSYSEVYVGDFNGDGREDILTRDPSNGNAVVRLSTVSGGNWAGWSNVWAAWPVSYSKVYVGDFNGDGKDDILTINPSTGAGILRQSAGGAGAWTGWTNFWAPLPSTHTQIYVGNFNGGTANDILTRDPSNGNAVMRQSIVSGGNWAGWNNVWAAWPVSYSWVYVGDYNGGGVFDILTANPSGGAVVRQSILSGGNWAGWQNYWAGW